MINDVLSNLFKTDADSNVYVRVIPRENIENESTENFISILKELNFLPFELDDVRYMLNTNDTIKTRDLIKSFILQDETRRYLGTKTWDILDIISLINGSLSVEENDALYNKHHSDKLIQINEKDDDE